MRVVLIAVLSVVSMIPLAAVAEDAPAPVPPQSAPDEPPGIDPSRAFGKRALELPTEGVLVRARKVEDGFDLRAQPGLVPWHADVAAAKVAAAASGRPVLVFQILGRLDDEFC